MLDIITDKSNQPTTGELDSYVGNPLFGELCSYMSSEYAALQRIEYSGDKALEGWNLKFKKGGRTLCTVYPRHEHFYMLLVIGRKEKELVESLLPTLSNEFQSIYNAAQEGMGQRWLILDFCVHTPLFDDALAIVKIRRATK